jgi:hypothetical protein
MTDKTEAKEQTREEILAVSLHAREQEIMHYQINIDNYTIALDEISKMSVADQAEMSGFKNQLAELLASEKVEQKKASIMLNVIKRQVQ